MVLLRADRSQGVSQGLYEIFTALAERIRSERGCTDDGLDEGDESYIVLEGNRRLAVLKALETPEILTGRLSDSEMRTLKGFTDGYEPIREVNCVVFEDRDAANRWIDMLHGLDNPAGLLPWSAQQKQRFRLQGGRRAPHLQVLDFVVEDGQLSDDARHRFNEGNYPISTLQRLLVTPAVREKLGIEFERGQVRLHYPKSEVLKGLSRVVDEIGTGAVKVNVLMRNPERVAYINQLAADELPNPQTRLPQPLALDAAPAMPGRKRSTGSRPGARLIPQGTTLHIATSRRAQDIYVELRSQLNVERTPNAVGTLFRVFLEISMAEYVKHHGIKVTTSRPEPTLRELGNAVIDHMIANGASKRELTAARRATDSASTDMMNAILHQPDYTPAPGDLRAHWTQLEAFFQRLWPSA